LHKLSAYYAREYDLVAVEDLDAKGLVEGVAIEDSKTLGCVKDVVLGSADATEVVGDE
jgi:hypothetical protein